MTLEREKKDLTLTPSSVKLHMEKVKRDEAMKRSGDMLLSGWRMLGISCPICNTAIMEKGGSMKCPSCNLPILHEGDMNISKYSSTPPDRQIETTRNADDHGEKHEYASEEKGSYQSLEGAKCEYDKSRQHQNAVSSKIGEYLLLGWTLLGAECQSPTCQGIPLMRTKETPPREICPSCNKASTKDGVLGPKDTLPPPAAASSELAPATGLQMEDAPFLDESGNIIEVDDMEDYWSGIPKSKSDIARMEDVSHQISQKMLQGWALLDKACEVGCSGDVPLLRDPKTGQDYCVVCGYLDNDTGIAEQSAKSGPVELTADQGDDSFGDNSVDSDDEFAAYADRRMRNIVSKVSTTKLSGKADAEADAEATSAVPTRPTIEQTGTDFDRQICVGVDHTLSVIDEKISITTSLLARSDDVSTSIELAQLVKALAEAKTALKRSRR